MNAAFLHLAFNHIPVLGTIFGVLLLALGMARRSRAVQQVALSLLVVAGLGAGAAYLTGEGAEEIVEKLPDVSHPLIELHEDAALFALVGASLAGVLALATLALGRQPRALPKLWVGATLVVGIVQSAIVARTAHLGGQVNHPELRDPALPASPAP